MDSDISNGRQTGWLDRVELSLSLADARDPELPLVFVNPAFCALTGYDARSILGRNCRFLQGPATGRQARLRVRTGIRELSHRLSTLVNYRADATPFDNALLIGPLREPNGQLVRLYGLQMDLGAREARRSGCAIGDWADAARERRFARAERLVGQVGRLSEELGTRAAHQRLLGRMIALCRAEQYPFDESVPDWAKARVLLARLLDVYRIGYQVPITIRGEEAILSSDAASAISLVLHEFVRMADSACVGQSGDTAIRIDISGDPRLHAPSLQVSFHLGGLDEDLASNDAARDLHDAAHEDEIHLTAEIVALAGGRLIASATGDGLRLELTVPNRPRDPTGIAT